MVKHIFDLEIKQLITINQILVIAIIMATNESISNLRKKNEFYY